MSKKQTLTLAAKKIPIVSEKPPITEQPEIIKREVGYSTDIPTTSPLPKNTQTTPNPTAPVVNVDLVSVAGIYTLKNNKLVVITDIDTKKKICYDATGQIWSVKGVFTLATVSREWDIVKLVVKLPENTNSIK